MVSTGDFSGDGKADILLHDDSGALDLLTMNGGQILADQFVGNTGTQGQLPPPHYDLI